MDSTVSVLECFLLRVLQSLVMQCPSRVASYCSLLPAETVHKVLEALEACAAHIEESFFLCIAIHKAVFGHV